MTTGWQTKRLGEIITLEYGKPLPDEKRKADGKYPVYGANGEKDRTDNFYYDKPSIIVGRKGSAGEVNLTEEKFWALDVTYFVKFDERELNLKFLYNLLFTLELPRLAKGVKPGINRNEVYSIEVRIPPLPEQQRIVAILDEAFEGIATAAAHAKKNLANARELFDSYLQSVFATKSEEWQAKNLGEVCLIKPPKNEARKNLKGSDLVSFVPMESLGIGQKYFDVSRLRSLEEVAGSYTYFADGDVLLAKITPCFENGKLGIAKNLKNGIGFGSSEYIVFRSSAALHNEFLYYFLSREVFREEGAKRMTGAVGHKRVAKEFIENTFISIPSFPEQQHITAKLDELSAETKRLEAIYQQKLVALDELKKSILNQAFSGQLHMKAKAAA